MYDQIARYYDLTHADLEDDIGYLLALAGQVNGPILELGCGSGRLLLPLARAGYTITGLDNSAVMLARAQARLAVETEPVQKRVTLLEGDMTTFTTDGYFALAIIPYNTLMHLEPEQVSATLKRVSRCLLAGGLLFIDLANPVAVAQTPNDRFLTLENTLVDPDTGDIIVQMASNWLDEAEQRLHVTWIYDVSPVGGGPVHRTVARLTYHYFYPHELELMLAGAGFKLQKLMGSYDESPFQENSERLLLLARLT